MSVRPEKTQISLGIRPDWSESSLSAWRKLGSLLPIERTAKTDLTGRMPRLTWVFAGRTVILLVLSCRGSYIDPDRSGVGQVNYCYTPPHKKWRSIMLYPPKTLKFWVSARPSVSASFPDSNLSSFWPIFFKRCMVIDVGEEWFGIANELNRVTALLDVKMSFPDTNLSSFWPLPSNFAWTLISGGSGLGLQMAKFVYKQQSYRPWFM